MLGKKKNIFKQAAFFFLMLVIITGCKKSEGQKATLSLQFQTVIGEANYSFLDSYLNQGTQAIRLEVFQFYISDITLVNKKGKETIVSDIELVKLDLSGFGLAEVKIPAGDYASLKFGIGVSPELNATSPSDHKDADHPLSSTQNTYWGMNSMYRFLMIDGRYDHENDGTMDGIFSYHTGYDDCYRIVEFSKDLSFDRKENYTEKITIDVTKLFNVSGSLVDVVNESNFHGEYSEIAVALRLSTNFSSSLSLQ